MILKKKASTLLSLFSDNFEGKKPFEAKHLCFSEQPYAVVSLGTLSPENGRRTRTTAGRIDWLRLPLRSLRPSVVVYAQPEVIDLIRATLLKIGGDDAVRLFRSSCFGHFLDYRGGDVQKRVIRALMTYEVHVPDRARVGQEAWFYIHHSQLRFGPSEYNLVSGVRFDGSTFDPNGDHIVPSRSVYHRLFEGKRTTVKQMEDRFKAERMARDAPDYVKVANILFVYRMILCLDQYRVVDPWVWALAEDVERWNSFPWDAYSYQMLMHFIGLVPRTRQAMGGKGSGQYHFYGPIWALQVWACEVIPELARETGVHSGQLTLPRCLRWTFSRPATDPATLLQRAVLTCGYVGAISRGDGDFILPEHAVGPGAQSMRFVPSRSRNKKKMLANAAACCSTSAEEVVPPSARDTRAARTPQKRRQATSRSSSRALRDEPDPDYIHGLRPPTKDVPEHTADPIHRESPPRAWGKKRSRRDRSQSSGEPSESFLRARRSPTPEVRDRHSSEPSDRSAAHRAPTPPLERAPQPTIIAYSRFRLQGPGVVIQLYFNGDRLRQSWFDELEDPSTELKDVHMSYFLSAIARRVQRDNGCPTMVANTGLYEALLVAWKTLHPLDPQCRGTYGDDDYRRWIPAERLIHRIQGSDGRYQVPWKGRDYAIMVCDVADEHWVVVRIRFSDWIVEFQMPPRCAFAMTLDKSIPDQYRQTDDTSCGVYACMYVERLLDAGPPSGIPEEAVHAYRKVIGARIYSLTYIKRPSL
ncbi:hypothetical protein C2S53_007316 [Perilla frutescens var. hirtella]|uniref:Ubiquitin-like protease family profile domain-containing protein n=1 Tax=Perilla frutescens var. hirtella TaxID=608512 RepID=A0AAD4IQR0_PERFH|nr:hypothetical protein C2S53_007316 [Perilla frutescens var. hirtella]